MFLLALYYTHLGTSVFFSSSMLFNPIKERNVLQIKISLRVTLQAKPKLYKICFSAIVEAPHINSVHDTITSRDQEGIYVFEAITCASMCCDGKSHSALPSWML